MIKLAPVCGISLLVLVGGMFAMPPVFLQVLMRQAESTTIRPGSVRTIVSTLPTMNQEDAILAAELGFSKKVDLLVDNLASKKALERVGLAIPIQRGKLELVLRDVHGVIEFSDALDDRMMVWIVAPLDERDSFPLQFNSAEYALNIRGQLTDRQEIAVFIALPAQLESLTIDGRVADLEMVGDNVDLDAFIASFSGSRLFLNVPSLETRHFALKSVTSRIDLRVDTLAIDEVFQVETIGGQVSLDAKSLRNNGGTTRADFSSTLGLVTTRLGKRPAITLHPNPSLGEIWMSQKNDEDVLGTIDLYATSRLASISIH